MSDLLIIVTLLSPAIMLALFICIGTQYPKLTHLLLERRFTLFGTSRGLESSFDVVFERALTSSETFALKSLLKRKYSALHFGPFTAKVSRHQIARVGSIGASLSTCLVARVKPVQNVSFSMDFPKITSKFDTHDDYQQSLIVLTENDELKQFLKSREFTELIFKLNSLAPGSIQCARDVFRVEVRRTLQDELELDAFVKACRAVFVKYAQQVQLYLPEWRGYDWWNEVVPDANNQKKMHADNQPTACGD